MPVNLISEGELRAALNPYRVDPEKFEAAVRERMKEDEGRVYDPLVTMPPWLRSAASLVPLEIFAPGQATGVLDKSALIVGTLSKLLGYVAFPAISLFVLLGSTIFGVAKIRRIQNESSAGAAAGAMDERSLRESNRRWWRNHRWGSVLLFVATLALSWFGVTWLMFLGYIVSTLILLYILKSFARIGIGNRQIVGASCISGLLVLGQLAGFAGIGNDEIHVLDQMLLVPLFFAGVLVVEFAATRGSKKSFPTFRVVMFAVVVFFMAAWFMRPILWPATPARINAYVESFDRAEFSSASWHEWEIVASWAVNSTPALDLSRPRRLLAEEIAEQDPALPEILNSALKVGLARADQISQLKDYEGRLRGLLAQPSSSRISLGWDDWVIRAAVLRNELPPEQRDYLAERLHATLSWSLTRNTPRMVNEPLRATQLLAVIGRPVNPRQYQEDVHALLRRLHSKTDAGFRRAGGFKAADIETIRVGDLDSTSDAIELMEFYGIPKDLDMTWVRSFVRPSAIEVSQQWIAAVTRNRFERLPGITRPSVFDIVYYERSFLAAVVLIGLCIYATAISPKPMDALAETPSI